MLLTTTNMPTNSPGIYISGIRSRMARKKIHVTNSFVITVSSKSCIWS